MALNPTITYAAGPYSGIVATAETTPTSLDTVELAVTASSTNVSFAINIDASQLQTIFLYSDTTCTVYTNATSGGAPAHTLTFVANKPLAWARGCPNANPFASTDVTTLYITNANTTTTVNIKGQISQNL